MDFEDSKKACEALETLTKLRVINWHESEDDEFEIVASISVVAHSGFAFSPYLHVVDPRGIAEFWLSVSEGMVRQAIGME
jgi:hypothetical protein